MSKLIDVSCFVEWDGKLGMFESNIIPGFSIERVFYIFDVPDGATRANHACMNADSIFVAINGMVSISVEYEETELTYMLNSRTKALYVSAKSCIRAYNFSNDAVLLCLSNKVYTECEYIEDYENYKRRK